MLNDYSFTSAPQLKRDPLGVSMGKLLGPYNADFPVGTTVRIAGRGTLERFQRPQYAYHHPLEPDQLQHAGRASTVIEVSYHHGGDELYELDGIPGLWHEGCLEAAP